MILRSLLISTFIAVISVSGAIAQDKSEQTDQTITYEDIANGTLYFKETFQDWRLRCQKNVEAKDECHLHQLLKNAGGGTVAQITVFNFPNAEGAAIAGANITVPLETALRENIKMRIDEKQAKAYPFSFCDKVGCHARLGLTAVEIKWMQDGQMARIATVPYRGAQEPVVVSVSLSGFTAGYKAVVENNKP